MRIQFPVHLTHPLCQRQILLRERFEGTLDHSAARLAHAARRMIQNQTINGSEVLNAFGNVDHLVANAFETIVHLDRTDDQSQVYRSRVMQCQQFVALVFNLNFKRIDIVFSLADFLNQHRIKVLEQTIDLGN